MSLYSNISTDEYNDIENSNSDCNSTDSESSTNNTVKRNYSSKCTSSLKDQDNKTSYFFSNIPMRTLGTFVFSLLICHLCFLLVRFHVSENSNNDPLTQDLLDRKETIQEFRKSLEKVKVKFKNQNVDTWHTFASQIEEIINDSTQISVVILLGNETNTITCLAHLFGYVSSRALNNDNYLTLNAKNIGNDHGEIIDKLKAEIQVDRVVIIEDLLTINSEAIKVLHNLCDKENPLVSKAVYIITIISDRYKGSHIDTFVEDSLTAKFSKTIHLDILNPLITRIMDGPIISVLPEPNMKESKIIKECFLF